MIRNIIFDMAGVLMRFDTEGYCHTHGISAGDRELLWREVFRSLEWAMQDRGSISDTDAISSICTRLPARLGVLTNLWLFLYGSYRTSRRIEVIVEVLDSSIAA